MTSCSFFLMKDFTPYQETTPDGTPVFRVGDFLSAGNEHQVHLDESGRFVLKIRGILGRFWQDMSARAAGDDLATLREYGFPVVPTQIFDRALLIYPQGLDQWVDYLITQPKIPHRSIHFSDLKKQADVLEAMVSMMQMRQRIFESTGLGVDPLGGRSYRALAKVLERWFRHRAPFLKNGYNLGLDPPIENVIQATEDVTVDDRNLVSRRDVLLVDTRLFRQAQQMDNYLHRLIASLVINPTHHVETGALEEALRRLGKSQSGPANSHWGAKLGRWAAGQIIDDLDLSQ